LPAKTHFCCNISFSLSNLKPTSSPESLEGTVEKR